MKTENEKIKKRKDVIRDSETIRTHVVEQMEKLDYSQRDILALAAKDGYKIDQPAFSRYLAKKSTGNVLTQELVLWLCKKLCIEIGLRVKVNPCQKKTTDSLQSS